MSTPKTTTVGADRRSALVLAAFGQIAQRGFEGLRTRDVAAEVGVNIATLHYYFPTKELLIQGVVEHAMNRFRTTLEPRGSPADQLRGYLRGTRRLLMDEPDLGRVMSELALRSSRDPELATVMTRMYELWHRTVRGLLKRAVKEGTIRPGLDTDDVAAVVVATLTAIANPSVNAARGGEPVRQLERWLGLSGRTKQVID